MRAREVGLTGLPKPVGALRLKGGGPAKPAAPPEKLSWQQHLIVGGVARGISVGTLFPIDSIKTRMQVGQEISLGLADVGKVALPSNGRVALPYPVVAP